MKSKTQKPKTTVNKKAKKIKDMSVDDFMNSFSHVGSDSSSDEDMEDMSHENNHNHNGYANGDVKEDLSESSEMDQDDNDLQSTDEDAEEGEDSDEGNDSVEEEETDDNSEVEDEDTDGAEEEGEEKEDSNESSHSAVEEMEEHSNDSAADDDNDGGDSEDGEGDVGAQHKKSLNNLKNIDPEFYKYLQENDKKLLKFDASDSDDSEGGSDIESDDDGRHHLPQKLELNSDESDYEPDGDDGGGPKRPKGVITLKMVKKWHESLQSDKSLQTLNEVIQAFHAALLRVAPEEERTACLYKVDGGAVFNAVVQLCVLELLPALRKYLNLTQGSLSYVNPVKCKRWVKIKTLVRSYVSDLLQLLGGIASVNISTIILKHVHQMTPFIVCFPNVTKQFLKKMISLWGTGEETVRVVSFMCILKATTLQQKTLLDQTLRLMYMAYVQNTKFVSPSTLPGINFMRRSLTEIFLLDENVSYHHAFLYIRQLAIHLRNAITLQKKESIQAVYNWQFVSSLALWIELLGSSSKQALQPLLYPIVQVTTGAIKLVPTAQYYPLRFHCARLLVNLSRNTGIFIPVLPFLLEVLNSYDFNKKHSKVSMKPLDFTCILRLTKVQLQENGFKDAVIESIYSLMLEYLANESHSIAFPDLSLPLIIQLRDFLKKCKVANYTRKFKQIVEKVEENVKFIEKERKTLVLQLCDQKAIEDWETALKVRGTPLKMFFESWQKLNCLKQSNQKTNAVDITEELPKIVRPVKSKPKPKGPVDLLPSDDSDSDGFGFDEEEEEELTAKTTRGKRGRKVKSGTVTKRMKVTQDEEDNEVGDIVEDLNLSEW